MHLISGCSLSKQTTAGGVKVSKLVSCACQHDERCIFISFKQHLSKLMYCMFRYLFNGTQLDLEQPNTYEDDVLMSTVRATIKCKMSNHFYVIQFKIFYLPSYFSHIYQSLSIISHTIFLYR